MVYVIIIIKQSINFLAKHAKILKGHGNEADFLGFLQKMVPHRSLTLPFEPFRFWLRICGDIHNRKTTPQLGESASQQLFYSASQEVADTPTRRIGESTTPPTHRVGESAFECLRESSAGWRVGDSPTQRVRELLTPQLSESGSRYLNFLKFIITLNDLTSLLKDQFGKKEARDVMYYHYWFI
jgi:hypothetical protein